MRVVILISSVLVCQLVAGSSTYTQAKAPDLIIVNAKIYTVDSRFSTVEGVAITDGKFTAVGTTAQIRKLIGPSTRILDAAAERPSYLDSRTITSTTPAAVQAWTFSTRVPSTTC